jgi:eukaryotic-like serine/threonine-protein kinase
VLRGSADSLPESGGIATLLKWSEEPLDLYPDDPRSAARRLPTHEQEWLECTGAVLFMPFFSQEGATRTLLGTIALGQKRSEEPYSAEDRELLSAIAAQVGLGLDVARLRRRDTIAASDAAAATIAGLASSVAECPVCRACYESGTLTCPVEGASLVPGALPHVVDAKYRVDLLLGRGGMGAVYRARDVRLDRDVAIKVVRGELLAAPEARARFRREAQLVARLHHPGVVSVFDYGTLPGGAAFLVMEFVRGRDLRSLVAEGARPADVARRLLTAIAEPVDAAHRQGVLHRDLKPENILLPDDGVVAKVLDFGVAKVLSGDEPQQPATETMTALTAVGQPIGTPAYMAPEQLSGGEMTARTDVYALGVIGYELLSGSVPFGRGSFVDIALRQRQGPPDLSHLDVPAALMNAITDALAEDPSQRPQSAALFAERMRKD